MSCFYNIMWLSKYYFSEQSHIHTGISRLDIWSHSAAPFLWHAFSPFFCYPFCNYFFWTYLSIQHSHFPRTNRLAKISLAIDLSIRDSKYVVVNISGFKCVVIIIIAKLHATGIEVLCISVLFFFCAVSNRSNYYLSIYLSHSLSLSLYIYWYIVYNVLYWYWYIYIYLYCRDC